MYKHIVEGVSCKVTRCLDRVFKEFIRRKYWHKFLEKNQQSGKRYLVEYLFRKGNYFYQNRKTLYW